MTLLSRLGPLTKRQLAKLGGLGWATVVKSIDDLMAAGIVEFAGTIKGPPGKRGKHAEQYTLSSTFPIAMGIDVEYRSTHATVVNLKGEVLVEERYRTVQKPDQGDVVRFLSQVISDFSGRSGVDLETLDGIGIGIPGIGFPSRSPRINLQIAGEIESELAQKFNTTMCIAKNTNAYTVSQKWSAVDNDFSDILWVTIRSGVGAGIIHRGDLYTGEHGLSGEIGHLKVAPGGPHCRCGNSGCLESVVNERYLFEQYRTRVLGSTMWNGEASIEDVREGLRRLFDGCTAGNEESRHVVGTAAGYLGRALAAACTILDINTIMISGHFGENGDALIKPLRDAIVENSLADIPLSVGYVPFDSTSYVRGAALLVFRKYLVNVPEET